MARAAAIYPFELCRSILRGMKNQLRKDGILKEGECGMLGANFIDEDSAAATNWDAGLCEVLAVALKSKYKDAQTGQPLEEGRVAAARREELEYFRQKGVGTKVSKNEAFARTGKAPISGKWVDVNKGDEEGPNYRSRYVAR